MHSKPMSDPDVDGCRLYNSFQSPVEAFVDDIRLELQNGKGFVPFVGAGISAPAGLPLLPDIKSYLERCITLSLGIDSDDTRPWNPRSDRWPSLEDHRWAPREDWVTKVYTAFDARRRRSHEHPDIEVFQEAVGAMAEWRTALLFLSRIVRDKRGIGPNTRDILVLDAPDHDVIDAGIRELMKGKEPPLGHRMLAALGGLLRLDIILTTNFDDLLERAFAAAHNPVSVFDIHLASALPPRAALSGQRALIKLHGNRYSVRVDYTLDSSPTEDDRNCFLQYFMSSQGIDQMHEQHARAQTIDKLPIQNHLLVLGFSAGERRTRAFIQQAWTHLDPDFKVFWICHSGKDVAKVRNFTQEVSVLLGRQNTDWRGSRIIQHPDVGLLFLHLFQLLRHALPVAGLAFPSVARLAVPPMPRIVHTIIPGRNPPPIDYCRDDSSSASACDVFFETRAIESIAPEESSHDARHVQAQPQSAGIVLPLPSDDRWRIGEAQRRAQEIQTSLEHHIRQLRSSYSRAPNIIVVTSKLEVRGITSVSADVYQKLEDEGDICIWIDMNDVAHTDDLFDKMLEAIYHRLGVESWMPVLVLNEPRMQSAEIHRLIRSSNRQWTMFLNAREVPGANFEDDRAHTNGEHPANGWLDRGTADDPKSPLGSFINFLGALCSPPRIPMAVVVLCAQTDHDPANARSTDAPLVQALQNNALIADAVRLTEDCVALRPDQPIEASISWTGGSSSKGRFLHALILMQRPRFLATVWSTAFCSSADANQSQDCLTWLNDLENLGLVRRKCGGFIWLHSRFRNELRSLFADADRFVATLRHVGIDPAKTKWQPNTELADIHAQLCQWYGRILAASDSPAAIFEAVYHACRSAEAALRTPGEQTLASAREMVESATSLIHANRFLIQTYGSSRGSCRHLEYIRDIRSAAIDALSSESDIRAATRSLRIRCTEVMRAIAREVGEDGRAYQRQRQIRALLLNEPLDQADKIDSVALYAGLFSGERSGADQRHDGVVEWLRWWRWNGMLGLASRSYPAARAALEIALCCLTEPSHLPDRLGEAKANGEARRFAILLTDLEVIAKVGSKPGAKLLSTSVRDLQRLRLEILRIIEQLVAHRLLESSVLRRLRKELPDDWSTEVPRLIEIGRTLVHQIVAHDHSSDGEMTTSAMWCESRLLMHESIRCIVGNERNRWVNAMKGLADAEACLSRYDPRRRGIDRAVIELHRAEVRLREAEETDLQVGGKAVADLPAAFGVFQQLGHHEIIETTGSSWRVAGEALRTKYCGHPMDTPEPLLKRFRIANAYVVDAMRFLTRAENELLSRRRNVWWTTWLMQRQLTAVAMTLWSTVFEQGAPIPFLGLEDAPNGTLTIADKLLGEAQRMIRVDAYRLATIVEAYGACATALHCRLMLDQQASRLVQRQEYMRDQLETSIKRLEDVNEWRMNWQQRVKDTAPNRTEKDLASLTQKAEMDPNVCKYIKRVIEQARETVRSLRYPLIGHFWPNASH